MNQIPTHIQQKQGALGSLIVKCWICGNDANSREHTIKASDLRLFHGRAVTPDKPIHLYSGQNPHRMVGSVKSKQFKTSKILCSRCNDTVTAPNDEAWRKLSTWLYQNWKTIEKSRRVKLHKVFPGAVGKEAIQFHLYFVKLFGCIIVDNGIPIDISQFSAAIRNKAPHPTLYLSFCTRHLADGDIEYVGPSDIYSKRYDGRIITASMYYTLGPLDVQISWFETPPLRNVPYAWNPNDMSKIIKFRAR